MSSWYLRTQDETFGPEPEEKLVEWARLGRIQPGQEISEDNEMWTRVEDVPFLDMRFSIDLGDGNPRGPFHRAAAEALLASGRLPKTATIVETREPFAPSDENEEKPKAEAEKIVEKEVVKEVPVEKIVEKVVEVPVEKIVEKEVIKEVPVEKIVEKVVEVPVEKIVEKEVVKEVPVEKIVEKVVEKVVVDETRVKELEAKGAADEARIRELEEKDAADEARIGELEAKSAADEARIGELEAMLADAKRAAGESEKACSEAKSREEKLGEQVRALEDELRRLPQTASEIADIQAAVYSLMTGEAEELAALIEAEKKEAEEFRRRHEERADRLLDRRRQLIKRAGTNIEDMTRRALAGRPEDPRAVRLRKEYDEYRRISEQKAVEFERRTRELVEQLRTSRAENARVAEGMRDVTQLRAEAEELRARLQQREQELLAEKQASETLRQQQATSQQTLMARLAALESPSIGTPQSLATNQSREAKLVKLPSWMRIGK